MDKYSSEDHKWMKRCFALAKKGAGYVAPNPLVGCVIVDRNGQKIGEGYHQKFGEAHAEIHALNSIKDKSGLLDATVYVSLEPCSHHGKTPPCADALAELPVKRIVVAVEDPNPQVSGQGIDRLRKSGKEVDVGLMAEEARELNEFFFHFIRYNRPFVTLKIAQTLDGYIAAQNGDSKWVSGKESRTLVHEWRSKYDAVMIGQHTAFNDNPRLTVRHVQGRQPWRIVIDGDYSLSSDLQLFSDQYEQKTIRVTYNQEVFRNEADPMLALLQPGYFQGETMLVSKKNGHSNLDELFDNLGARGFSSILVEPGRNLASAMIKDRLVDKLEVFVAPKLLGGGIKSVLGLGVERMNEAYGLKKASWKAVGNDLLYTAYL